MPFGEQQFENRPVPSPEKEGERASESKTEAEETIVGEYDRFGAKVEEILGVSKEFWESLSPRKREFVGFKDIVYSTKNGERVSMAELLPENWAIKKDWKARSMEADFDSREIIYGHCREAPNKYKVSEPLSVPSKGFFLGLLHEIGHAHAYEKLTPEQKEVFKKKTDVVGDEREAWAWALRKFRKLRREGIDLEPAMSSNKEILKRIEAILSVDEKKMAPGSEEFQKAHRIFWGEE